MVMAAVGLMDQALVRSYVKVHILIRQSSPPPGRQYPPSVLLVKPFLWRYCWY